jgi:hypothetical protein
MALRSRELTAKAIARPKFLYYVEKLNMQFIDTLNTSNDYVDRKYKITLIQLGDTFLSVCVTAGNLKYVILWPCGAQDGALG